MNDGSSSCAVASSPSLPPPPPAGPSGSDGSWITIGVLLCLLSVGLLVLGTNIQRYGLTVVAERGCNGASHCCLHCASCSNAVWLSGWIVYAFGNGVYTFAVTLAPATLCSALLGTAVVWNALISRFLLGERVEACDCQGGLFIMLGIALIQVFGPTDSVEHTAMQFLALLDDPGGVAYLLLVILLIVSLAVLVLCHERYEARSANQASSGTTLLAHLVPFAYPMVVGAIESLQQLCLIAVSRMFYRSLAGDDQLCHATFWVVLAALLLMILGQVWWLRKALLHLEVTRVLPIEYGTVASLAGMCADSNPASPAELGVSRCARYLPLSRR